MKCRTPFVTQAEEGSLTYTDHPAYTFIPQAQLGPYFINNKKYSSALQQTTTKITNKKKTPPICLGRSFITWDFG